MEGNYIFKFLDTNSFYRIKVKLITRLIKCNEESFVNGFFYCLTKKFQLSKIRMFSKPFKVKKSFTLDKSVSSVIETNDCLTTAYRIFSFFVKPIKS